MDDLYKIYVDQLREGKVQRLDRCFPSEILELDAEDLSFQADILVNGEAYLADDSLILHIDLSTEGVIPCSICNNPVDVPIRLRGVYHVVPVNEIKGHIFDLREVVRESVLLEAPSFVECHGGKCPERGELKKYLKNREGAQGEHSEGFKPFSDLT